MNQPKKTKPTRNQPNRRAFIAASLVSAAAASTASAANLLGSEREPTIIDNRSFDLSELSIAQLQERIENGEDTSRSLVDKYLDRINEIDGQLRSTIELNPDVHVIAEQMDRQRRAGQSRGPLHGIPVMIKDNIDSADKMKTTAGSLALLDTPKPPEDSCVVKRLRSAGAVLLGKTNLSEWANIRSSHSTSGWSGRGGQTNNPYALDRNPCGSSSGSGAAVSASLCAVAVGTETDGSILCPSACCGIVGLKPTVGLIGRTGIIPISHSQDTAGPMARSVRDATILLTALAGVDPHDEATVDARTHGQIDYVKFLDAAGLKGAKIGVARNFFGFHDGVESVMNVALGVMESEGAALIDTESLAKTDGAGSAEGTVLQYELKHDMAAYLARLGDASPMKTLKDLIEFNDRNRESEMPFFGQDFFIKAEQKGPLTEFGYIEARAKCLRLTRTEGIDAAFEEHEVDCFVAPTISLPCVTDPVNGDHWLGSSTSPAAISGYPSITVPAGYVFGLPVGMSFFGAAWSEPTLIRLAYAFEQASKFRQPPRFLPTADLNSTEMR